LANQFTYKDNTFQLTTLNRQKTFYYRLTKPIEVWGNYYTLIAFYDRNNDLIYHRHGCFAHALQVDNSLEFVKWSDTSNEVLFYEYKRGHISDGGMYHYVLIDLTGRNTYRIDLYKYEHRFLDKLQSGFSATETIKQIEELGIVKEPCFSDKIIISPLKWLTGVDKWKPTSRL
jgi:hypothetical protein